MRIRRRDYGEEAKRSGLVRETVTGAHPLDASPPVSWGVEATPPRPPSAPSLYSPVEFEDPLRVLVAVERDPLTSAAVALGASAGSTASPPPSIPPPSQSPDANPHTRPADASWLCGPEDEASREAWDERKHTLLQRFKSSSSSSHARMVWTLDDDAAAADGAAGKGGKGRGGASLRLQELEDPEADAREEAKVISSHEYAAKLATLKADIISAWSKAEHMTALKLAIKVAGLLRGCSVPSFYPTLFILVTEVLDSFGSLVFERIRSKAECDDGGAVICKLPPNFNANDIRSEAKSTCSNWFAKVAAVYDLVPRLYLELALVRCYYYLNTLPPVEAFTRLAGGLRGIGDPLASAYACLYLSRRAMAVLPPGPQRSHLLLICVHDYRRMFQRALDGDFQAWMRARDLHLSLFNELVEPVFEWAAYCLSCTATQREQEKVLENFSEGGAPHVVMLKHLLAALPAHVVTRRALPLAAAIADADDRSARKSQLYRQLGIKLCECPPPKEATLAVLHGLWKAVSRLPDLLDFIAAADALIEFSAAQLSGVELGMLLDDTLKRISVLSPDTALELLASQGPGVTSPDSRGSTDREGRGEGSGAAGYGSSDTATTAAGTATATGAGSAGASATHDASMSNNNNSTSSSSSARGDPLGASGEPSPLPVSTFSGLRTPTVASEASTPTTVSAASAVAAAGRAATGGAKASVATAGVATAQQEQQQQQQQQQGGAGVGGGVTFDSRDVEAIMGHLASIVSKTAASCVSFASFLQMEHAQRLLDALQGDARRDLYKNVLASICKRKERLTDPATRHTAFELAAALHDGLDCMSSGDERRQITGLIAGLLPLFEFGRDFEHKFEFLAECRHAFPNLDPIMEVLVCMVCTLAADTLHAIGGTHTKRTLAFVKACAAYCHVCVPSIASALTRIRLYTAAAEVSLLNGLVPQAEALVQAAIACLQEATGAETDPWKAATAAELEVASAEEELLSLLAKLAGLFLVLPGHPENGPFVLLRSLVSAICHHPWRSPERHLSALTSLLLLHAGLAQGTLACHVAGLESNDRLFCGNASYTSELALSARSLVEKIVQAIDAGAKGPGIAQKALDMANTLLIAYEASPETATIIAALLDVAKAHVPHAGRNAYLRQTCAFLEKRGVRWGPAQAGTSSAVGPLK